jgi:hypothetical protein
MCQGLVIATNVPERRVPHRAERYFQRVADLGDTLVNTVHVVNTGWHMLTSLKTKLTFLRMPDWWARNLLAIAV